VGEARRRALRGEGEPSARLLVVDWDYFVPVPLELDPVLALMNEGFMMFAEGFLSDRGETPSLDTTVWALNAPALLSAGRPLIALSGEESSFWRRFRFRPGASAFVARENYYAVAPQVREGVGEVWLYDAHHDCGYGAAPVEDHERVGIVSNNWMLDYGLAGCPLKVRYPRWRDWALHHEPEPIVPVDRRVDGGERESVLFDRVFICRSDFYTPPWLDSAFKTFLDACPLTVEPLEELTLRPSDRQTYFDLASSMRASREWMQREQERQRATFGATETEPRDDVLSGGRRPR